MSAIKTLEEFVNQYIPVSASEIASSPDKILPSVSNLPLNLSLQNQLTVFPRQTCHRQRGTSLRTPKPSQSILNGISALFLKVCSQEKPPTRMKPKTGRRAKPATGRRQKSERRDRSQHWTYQQWPEALGFALCTGDSAF